ncbi:hypothetical protein BH20ACI4_BH20ACI4_03460 [soil metagenome]
MQLDDEAKKAVRELGDAINRAVEKNVRVADAIENLREIGYEPHLNLKLEIGLQEITLTDEQPEDFTENSELDITDEDVRTLRRMKIKF